MYKKRNTPATPTDTESKAESVDEAAAIEMSPEVAGLVSRFAEATGYSFNNPDFLLCALTRPSAIALKVRLTGSADFEKYEFAGDGLLGFAVRSLLNEFHPEYTLGQLNDEYQRLTRNADAGHAHGGPMYRIAKEIGLRDFIIKHESEDLERAGHRGKTKHGSKRKTLECILADHMEALLYAIYLDSCSEKTPKGDFEVVFDFVERFWGCLGLNEAVKSVSDYGRSLFSIASTGSEIPDSSDGGYSDPYGVAGAGAGDPDTHLILAATQGREEFLRDELECGNLSFAQVEKITRAAAEYGKNNVVSSILNAQYLRSCDAGDALALIKSLLSVVQATKIATPGGQHACETFLMAAYRKLSSTHGTRPTYNTSFAAYMHTPVRQEQYYVNLLLQEAKKGKSEGLAGRLDSIKPEQITDQLVIKALVNASDAGKHNFVSEFIKLVLNRKVLDEDGLYDVLVNVWDRTIATNVGGTTPSQDVVMGYLRRQLRELGGTEEAESSGDGSSYGEAYDEAYDEYGY